MAITIIDVDIDAVPYEFNIELTHFTRARTYTIKFLYNDEFDFFTLSIADDEGDIVNGIKMVYDNPVFNKISNTRLPDEVLFPSDAGNIETEITFENFNQSVFLYSLDAEEFI